MADNSTNNITSGKPNDTSGKYHSVKGTIVEAVGDLTGSGSWKQSGKEEHAAGEAEQVTSQFKESLGGLKDTVVNAVSGTGGKAQQTGDKVKEQVPEQVPEQVKPQ